MRSGRPVPGRDHAPRPRPPRRTICRGRSGRAYWTRSPKYSPGRAVGRDHDGAAGEPGLKGRQAGRLEPAWQPEDTGRRVGGAEQRVGVVHPSSQRTRPRPSRAARFPVRVVSGDHRRRPRQAADRGPSRRGSNPGDSSEAPLDRRREQSRRARTVTGIGRAWRMANLGSTPFGTTSDRGRGRHRRGVRADEPRRPSSASTRRRERATHDANRTVTAKRAG